MDGGGTDEHDVLMVRMARAYWTLNEAYDNKIGAQNCKRLLNELVQLGERFS